MDKTTKNPPQFEKTEEISRSRVRNGRDVGIIR
jgi:hypothetical protein